MMKDKKRLDIILTERGLFPSREKARAAIMAGEVLVNDQKIDKAGAAVDTKCQIRLLGEKLPYVSRGGLKLAKAISSFGIDMQNKIVLDIGASTGGFVDCSLQNGAQKVYAVDVGYNQLAWSLRNDPRVVVMEKTNARYLDATAIPEMVDMLTADVSFISLTLVLPSSVQHLLKPGGEVAALIKPQFEAGREAVGKGGIVRDKLTHKAVIEKVLAAFCQWGLGVRGLDFSPITGMDGNIEYLVYAVKGGENRQFAIDDIIDEAHEHHKKKAAHKGENQ